MLLNQPFCSLLFHSEPCQVIPISFRCKSLRSPWITLALCSLTHSNAWQTNGEANWQRHRAQRSRAQGVPGNWTSDGGRRTTRWVSYLMAVKPDRLPSAIHHPPSTFYLPPPTRLLATRWCLSVLYLRLKFFWLNCCKLFANLFRRSPCGSTSTDWTIAFCLFESGTMRWRLGAKGGIVATQILVFRYSDIQI